MSQNRRQKTETKDDLEDTEKTYVSRISEFGNGSHVVLPRSLVGMTARIEIVGSWIPPLFEGIEEDREVMVKSEDEGRLIGEVIEVEEIGSHGKIEWSFTFDTGHDFYRVSIERSGSSEEWSNKYTLEKAVDGEEAREEIDEIISMEPSNGGMWAPFGSVNGVAVLEETDD